MEGGDVGGLCHPCSCQQPQHCDAATGQVHSPSIQVPTYFACASTAMSIMQHFAVNRVVNTPYESPALPLTPLQLLPRTAGPILLCRRCLHYRPHACHSCCLRPCCANALVLGQLIAALLPVIRNIASLPSHDG